MSKNKHPNKIDILEAVQLFHVYGFKPHTMNFYQIRLRDDSSHAFYDWYHTTGSLVKIDRGNQTKLGTILDPEDVAMFIRKNV